MTASTLQAVDPRAALLIARGLPVRLVTGLQRRGSHVLPLPAIFDDTEVDQ